jgi:indolepyruvate ferredoxin oxidoreductase beta subunit
MGQILTKQGTNVISSETHGMAVRGGSINSHLRVGPFFSPMIRHGNADFLLSLDAGETQNNRHFLKDGGYIIENSADRDEPGITRIDAAGIARSLGRVQLENVVLLGFACRMEGFPLGPEDVKAHLAEDPREAVRSMNIRALDAGLGHR